MSIINKEKLADHISNWMKDYCVRNGIRCGVLGLSGGIDSALVALLWKKTGLPLICVNLPCHSSPSAFIRANNFAEEYGLTLRKIDLGSAHDSLYSQAKVTDLPFEGNVENPIAVGGMRSCLRPAVLNFFSNAYRGIVVGTGNRSEDHITRYFQKFGDGCVDISPISDLFKSEVRELFAHLAITLSLSEMMPLSAQVILDAKPTADLWGPESGQEDEKELGISYDEIEWADREDMRTTEEFDCGTSPGIIFSDDDPTKASDFFRYTDRQQKVIAKLHAMEKVSRHKVNPNLPMCTVRDQEGLVR